MLYNSETFLFHIVEQSLAAFPSTYFYAHFGISHYKTLDGNAKMRINSKLKYLSRIHFLSDKKRMCMNKMETHLPLNSSMRIKKVM